MNNKIFSVLVALGLLVTLVTPVFAGFKEDTRPQVTVSIDPTDQGIFNMCVDLDEDAVWMDGTRQDPADGNSWYTSTSSTLRGWQQPTTGAALADIRSAKFDYTSPRQYTEGGFTIKGIHLGGHGGVSVAKVTLDCRGIIQLANGVSTLIKPTFDVYKTNHGEVGFSIDHGFFQTVLGRSAQAAFSQHQDDDISQAALADIAIGVLNDYVWAAGKALAASNPLGAGKPLTLAFSERDYGINVFNQWQDAAGKWHKQLTAKDLVGFHLGDTLILPMREGFSETGKVTQILGDGNIIFDLINHQADKPIQKGWVKVTVLRTGIDKG
jgi:hypothetical protein